jgi:GNAT superfamily N-acetyltransferase
MPYPDDPALRRATVNLLGSVWSRLPGGIEQASAWGADWFQLSTPFVHLVEDQPVAHVGVIELPVVIAGRERLLAGIHAVCTLAGHRGRGHLRQTLERTLAWVETRYEAAVLWANDPAIYTRFGFVPCAESIFQGPVSRSVTGGAGRPALRTLSLDCADDVRLLRSRLAARAPVSSRCSTREPGQLALIDLALWPPPRPAIVLIAALDCIVIYEVEDHTLWLYDVIAPRMPALAELTAALGGPLDRVAVCFSPDQLAAPELAPAPTPLTDFLMVRGTLLAGAEPLAFSPLARC